MLNIPFSEYSIQNTQHGHDYSLFLHNVSRHKIKAWHNHDIIWPDIVIYYILGWNYIKNSMLKVVKIGRYVALAVANMPVAHVCWNNDSALLMQDHKYTPP